MKRVVLLALAFLALALPIMGGAVQAADYNPLDKLCSKEPAKSSPTCQQNSAQQGNSVNPVVRIIHDASSIIALVAGAAAVIVIIYGAFVFVTAGGVSPGQRSGDPNRIKTARSAITGGLVGLALIALSWTIINFVTNAVLK